MYKLHFDAPEIVTKRLGRAAKNHWMICESMTDFAGLPNTGLARMGKDWRGGVSVQDAKNLALTGDMSQVAASDAYLEKLEANMILSGRKAWIDDVAGAVPNVGAFLSGSPCAMRYRKKTSDDSAPIGIVYDGTVSGGVTVETMRKRGTIALALVRLLSARRPVELWFMVGVEAGKEGKDGGFVAVRIDTSPLDLARAGYALAHPAATRCLGYGAACNPQGHNSTGNGGARGLSWPYKENDQAMTCEETRESARQALPHLSDILAIPGQHLNDPMLKDPEGWLRAQVTLYAGGES